MSSKHACIHEALHIVSHWIDGGEAKGTWVVFEKDFCWGFSDLPALSDGESRITMLAVGGLAELRLTMKSGFQFDVKESADALLRAAQAAQPSADIPLPAHNDNGDGITIIGNMALNFSDDLMLCHEAALNYPDEARGAFEEAVRRVNDAGVWNAGSVVAAQLETAPGAVCTLPGEMNGQNTTHHLDKHALATLKNQIMPNLSQSRQSSTTSQSQNASNPTVNQDLPTDDTAHQQDTHSDDGSPTSQS